MGQSEPFGGTANLESLADGVQIMAKSEVAPVFCEVELR